MLPACLEGKEDGLHGDDVDRFIEALESGVMAEKYEKECQERQMWLTELVDA